MSDRKDGGPESAKYRYYCCKTTGSCLCGYGARNPLYVSETKRGHLTQQSNDALLSERDGGSNA